MTESHQAPQSLVALYRTLADATAALTALQEAGVPYANITMESHAGAELSAAMAQPIELPEHVWALVVAAGDPLQAKSEEVLRAHQPFLTGSAPSEHNGRTEVDRGRTAWGHYVFEPVAATDQIADAAGTSGTTGVISSGVFSNDSVAETNPSDDAVPDKARG